MNHPNEPPTEWLKAAIENHPNLLSYRTQRMLELYYGVDGPRLSDEEIARTLNLDPPRIHRGLARGLEQLGWDPPDRPAAAA